MMVFDLDPGAPATIRDCAKIAIELRDLLSGLGLRSFPKTSGGKGLHVVVPLNGGTAFAAAKPFAHVIAELLARRHPDHVTSVMAKSGRIGKVFIDWSQNDHGKTTACVYTLRAQSRPTVSVPLAWAEVERAREQPEPGLLVFEADKALERSERMGDLFKPVLTLRQRLPADS